MLTSTCCSLPVINGRLNSHLGKDIAAAAIGAGLPESQVEDVVTAAIAGTLAKIPDLSPAVLAAITTASEKAYAAAFRLAWSSIIPFVVLAIVLIACLRGVKELMTEHVEATVERVAEDGPADKA